MDQDSGFESFSTQISSLNISEIERDNFSQLFGTYSSSSDSSSEDFKSSGELVISDSTTPEVIGCKKRKNYVPQRASHLNDPNFRGVTITMKNKLVDGEWKFITTKTFSLPKKQKRIFKPYTDSSEDDEPTNNYASSNEVLSDRLWLVNKKTGNFTEKHCASCSTMKTPLWRDAEDGTPLCNACGIRYKKYKMRCDTCWHIPKKDEVHPRCRFCGSSYVSPRS